MVVSDCLFSERIYVKFGIVDLYKTLREFHFGTLPVLCQRNITSKCKENNPHAVWINTRILLRV